MPADDQSHEEDRSEAMREAAAAWDRFGQFLENTGTIGNRIAQRNLDLWSAVAQRLDSGRCSSDDVVPDAAKIVGATLRNLNDLWSAVTTLPTRESVAGVVPTAFLFFDRRDERSHALLDPILIPVPGYTADNRQISLPERAEIALSGTSSEGAERLRATLVAHLHTPGTYLLETIAPDTSGPEVGKVSDLIFGAYDGFVYITDPARPLVNLRIIVEGPPPV